MAEFSNTAFSMIALAGGEAHAVPTALGMGPTQWVSLSMLVLLAIAFFKAKVHKKIAAGLDGQINVIREQLDEAKELRKEAEALRAEYEAKIAGAEKDAEAMLDRARQEAEQIRSQAEADSTAMIERRKQMAESKIAAAQRSAIDDVRAAAANAATAAAQSLIAQHHDAKADASLTEELIREV